MEIAIAIMAGGGSTRMGRDKALLELEGEMLLERIARRASATGRTVAVIGRNAPAGWSLPDVLFIPDDYPGAGPLGGLVTALRCLSCPVLALACDLPLLTTHAIQWLLGTAEHIPLNDGLLTINNGRIEPLFSVYFPSAAPLAENLLAANRRSLHALHESGTFTTIDLPPEIAITLRNVNTPEDFRLTIFD